MRFTTADQLLAEGADVAEICRHLEISVQIYQRWRRVPKGHQTNSAASKPHVSVRP
jgi:transposase-like protein